MTKKTRTYYDKFINSLTSDQRKNFENNHREFLISEMLIAAMEKDKVTVRELAKLAGVSPTIVQGMRSGTRKNVTLDTLSKVLKPLGYSILIEKGDIRLPLEIKHR